MKTVFTNVTQNISTNMWTYITPVWGGTPDLKDIRMHFAACTHRTKSPSLGRWPPLVINSTLPHSLGRGPPSVPTTYCLCHQHCVPQSGDGATPFRTPPLPTLPSRPLPLSAYSA